MDWFVELELVVGDDFTGPAFLIGEDTIFEGDDGVGGADGFALGGNGLGDVVGSDLEGAGVIFIAATGTLSGDGGGQDGEQGDGGEGLHGDCSFLKR